jgi:hypothetical protein
VTTNPPPAETTTATFVLNGSDMFPQALSERGPRALVRRREPLSIFRIGSALQPMPIGEEDPRPNLFGCTSR